MDDARLRRLQANKNLAVPSQQPQGGPVPRKRIEARVIHLVHPTLSVSLTTGHLAEATQEKLETLAIKETIAPAVKEDKSKQEFNESEDDGSSDEADLPTPLMKPVFVRKESRKDLEQLEQQHEYSKKEKEREAHQLLLQYVRREYEASSSTVNDDSDLVVCPGDLSAVDDTDDLEDAAEVEAWRLRELLRIKRDRELSEHWEREKMELERIRNMTEEERRLCDEQKMKEWMAQPKSQMRFMQKYYHKGAFFQDPAESIFQRDYAQPTGEDAKANREMLPEVKQVRDFGKKGRTKWTHLVGEDTTEFSYGWGQRKNDMNYKMVSKMGGMKGNLDNAYKRPKT